MNFIRLHIPKEYSYIPALSNLINRSSQNLVTYLNGRIDNFWSRSRDDVRRGEGPGQHCHWRRCSWTKPISIWNVIFPKSEFHYSFRHIIMLPIASPSPSSQFSRQFLADLPDDGSGIPLCPITPANSSPERRKNEHVVSSIFPYFNLFQ